MSANKKEGFEIAESIDKVEHYVHDNKKSLSIIGGTVVLVLLAYFGYNQFIVKPQEEEARENMFIAEQYFGQDSINLAIAGDGSYPGFEEIVENYGSSPSGNLANYYLGMSYLKKGEYEKAIEALMKSNGYYEKIAKDYYEQTNDAVGGLRKIPMHTLMFFIHAYQSELWNNCASKIKKDIDLPIVGFGTEIKDKKVKTIIENEMQKENIDYRDFSLRQNSNA